MKQSHPKIPDDEFRLLMDEINKYNDGTFHYEEYIKENSYSAKKNQF